MNRPYFSIIIPCYNQAHWLPEAINSVLSQDFQNWELFIVNDGSTDNTEEVADQFKLSDARIRVIHKVNGGLSSARNAALQNVRGEFIHFLDADDFCLDHFYRKAFEYFSRTDIDIIVVGYSYVIDGHFYAKVSYPFKVIEPSNLLCANFAPPVSFIVKNEIVNVIGSFDENLKSAEDWDYWVRAVKAGAKICTIPDVLVAYRYVGNSMSRNAFRMYEALKEVAHRAPFPDNRITVSSPLNVHHIVDVTENVKKILFSCLGVSVMQGKVKESLNLFRRELDSYKWDLKPLDCAGMYSYLSFRYWKDKDQIAHIYANIYPNYVDFFKAPEFSNHFRKEALSIVFNPVNKIQRVNKYGKILGGILNRIY